jgi:hypothetical protein
MDSDEWVKDSKTKNPASRINFLLTSLKRGSVAAVTRREQAFIHWSTFSSSLSLPKLSSAAIASFAAPLHSLRSVTSSLPARFSL